MSTLAWIVGSGVLMSLIALVGSVTLVLKESTVKKLIRPLVAFAAGSLLGGAFLHMVPAGLSQSDGGIDFFLWVLVGFVLFFALEGVLHWHHCHRADAQCKRPLGYLILIGDTLHNFLGGLAIAGTFLIDIKMGIAAWLAAAAHEVPQELGDFAVLVHGGWSRGSALFFNILSALTFLVGALLAYGLSRTINVDFLVPFAAGNFIYIGASDLVPEVNKHRTIGASLLHLLAFISGIAAMALVRILVHHNH